MSNQQPYQVESKSPTAVAVSIAAKAGEWVLNQFGEVHQAKTKWSDHDLVTDIDRGAEKMIRKLLAVYYPEHDFLGEEGVAPGPDASQQAIKAVEESENLWIVDPIDGTTNFVHGFPYYCVSIALARKGQVMLGVIYDPSRDEMFVAERGKGVYLGGKKMGTSLGNNLSTALLATGFPVDKTGLSVNLNQLQAIVPMVRNVRATGSAALHMAYVATGRLSGFWEMGLNSWDLAAGALMVEEAGGQVSDLNGRPYTLGVRNVVASNGKIHEAFQDVLQQAVIIGPRT